MGGFITSAADITMAYSMASILESNQGFASINLQTTFYDHFTPERLRLNQQLSSKAEKHAMWKQPFLKMDNMLPK